MQKRRALYLVKLQCIQCNFSSLQKCNLILKPVFPQKINDNNFTIIIWASPGNWILENCKMNKYLMKIELISLSNLLRFTTQTNCRHLKLCNKRTGYTTKKIRKKQRNHKFQKIKKYTNLNEIQLWKIGEAQ